MAMRGPARFICHRATRGLSSMLIRRSISQTSSFRSLFQSNTMNTRPRHVETEDQIKGMMGGITFTDVAIDGQGYRFANLLCISGSLPERQRNPTALSNVSPPTSQSNIWDRLSGSPGSRPRALNRQHP